ncbi:MAG: hypothetical protein WC782_15990 [Methylococcaceae bacterium]
MDTEFFFETGLATGFDKSQAESGVFKADKASDLNMINIGEERY